MHRSTRAFSLGSALAVPLMVGLALLAPRVALAAAAPSSYTFQPLAQIGGMAGDIPIPKGLIWALGPLTDNGQFIVDAGTPTSIKPELLLQYSSGKFTSLTPAGMPGPIGPWPADVEFSWPYSMNARGDSVFQVGKLNSANLIGDFLRDAASGQITAVALPGMPATGNLTFTTAPASPPAINNHGEIALPVGVKEAGGASGGALFFRTPDGALQPILLPGQALPDGKRGAPYNPSITDAGVVAFQVGPSAYQWENGSITPLATVGMAVPGGGKIEAVGAVLLNNQNASALISARVTNTARENLYRLAGGTLTPLAVAGQPMPGGGTFKSIAFITSTFTFAGAVSTATEAGQHAFVATLDDNSTGVYRLDADGTLSLVAKTGMTTPLGTIAHFGQYSPPAMNSKGQVVVSASFDNGPDTLVLLTPVAP